MTPTITQSRKRVTEYEILRRLMRLSMTSRSLQPGAFTVSQAGDSFAIEETRSNDSALARPLS